MALPKISVILPVRNEARCIGRLLDQLIRQTYPAERYEILVCDGRSTDNTRDVVNSIAAGARMSIQVVDNPGIRSGAGRNAGITRATGDIILFIDGHCEIPSLCLLEDTAKILDETGADCLCRPQPLLAYAPDGIGRVIADVRASTLGHGRDSLIYDMVHAGFVPPASSGATYRASIFDQLGGYDENFDACEDVEFNTRVAASGFRAYTDPRLAVYYEPRRSLRGLWRQMMRYGIGRVRLARKHPDAASVAQWAPAVLLAAFVGGLLVSAISYSVSFSGASFIAALSVAPPLLFACITIAASLDLGRRHGWKHCLWGPAAYCTIYAALGAGMWKELLWSASPRKSSWDAVSSPATSDHAT